METMNIQQSIFCAALCGQTYVQFDNADGSFIVPQGFRFVCEIQAKSFSQRMERFGFVIESDQKIMIAFRGTSSTSDWISDLQATQVRFKPVNNNSYTHRGFTGIYNSLRLELKKQLRGLSPAKKMILTGHSLGGALAMLCAADLASNGLFEPVTVYTYGAPRVGNPEFAKSYAALVDTSYRVVNPNDVVPMVPPPILKLPRHERTFYYLHAPQSVALPFEQGSISGNHIISSYYEALSIQDPLYAMNLCEHNPGFCPLDFYSILIEGIV